MSVAALLAQSFTAVPDLVRATADEHPQAPALLQDERRLNYAELANLVDRVAAALQRDGHRPGDAIAICAGASPEYAVVFLGGLRAGLTVVPLAPSATAEALATMVADADASLFFVDAPVAEALAPIAAQLTAKRIALDGSDAGRSFQDWLAPVGAQPAPVTIKPDWPFNIIYSSGTTGTPKGIVQPHRMRWGHVRRGADQGFGPGAIALLSTPLYSNTTLVPFFQTLALGGAVLLMAKFDAAAYLALAEQHKATHTTLVPVQYQRIMAQPDFDSYDLSSFRYKFSTSAPFPAALKTDVLNRWPGALLDVYGMTEGGGTCLLASHLHPDKLHTVGQPAAGHDVRIIDEDGRELPHGETGEIVGRSQSMMIGYHKRPAQTAEAEWHDSAGNRYIRTGDIGRFDQDGFLTLVDRKKDMIISGGFNIYPSDLEDIIIQHPEVADVAVIGVASQRWGETPVAFAVLRPGSGLTADALRDWANSRLGRTQRLAAVRLVAALPRSAIGKVLKRELRVAYDNDVAQTA